MLCSNSNLWKCVVLTHYSMHRRRHLFLSAGLSKSFNYYISPAMRNQIENTKKKKPDGLLLWHQQR